MTYKDIVRVNEYKEMKVKDIKRGDCFLHHNTPFIKTWKVNFRLKEGNCVNIYTGEVRMLPDDTIVRYIPEISIKYWTQVRKNE